MSRCNRWSSLLVLGWAVAACTGPVANDGLATEVAFFRAEATQIERGGDVALEWQVDHAGERAGEPSCAVLRQVAGAAWEDPIAVPCVGSRRDTPPYPADAASVTYRLRVVDRSSAGYQTSDVTVAFLPPSIAIDPVHASVLTSGTVAFTATVQGAVDTGVAWSTSCGSISGSGASVTFVAPAFAATCTVTATSLADARRSATATVVVTPPATGAVAWSVTFGSDEDDRVQLVATDAEGSVYVAGTTEGLLGTTLQSPLGVADGFVRKYDGNGVAQWTWQFGTQGADRVLLLEPQPNGDVIVGGTARPAPAGSDDTVFVARFDAASQSVAWRIEFGADAARYASAMARDPQGNVFVASSEDHMLLVKYDPDGLQLWRRVFQAEAYYGSASRLVADAVGGVVAAGAAYQIDFVMRVEPDGDRDWRTTLRGLDGYFHWGRDVAFEPNGNVVYVGTGFSWSHAPDVGWVAMLDADGVQLWLRDVGPGVATVATAVAAAYDGSSLVGGWSAGDLGAAGGGSGGFVTKYAGDGDRTWVQRFADVPQTGFASIATDGQGSAYAVATVAGLAGSGGDVFLVKMAP